MTTSQTDTTTLVNHGGVRTITTGTITVTKRIARQLDRINLWTNSAEGFTALARVHTGTTVEKERLKADYRHYPKHMIDPLKHYEVYQGAPYLEVVGYYPDSGTGLLLFQIESVTYDDDEVRIMGEADPGALRRMIRDWADLPLAVLP
jgi:hypothetical protein